MNEESTAWRERTVGTSDLQPGMEVRYLGAIRHVLGVRPSLGRGWEVTFSDGPSGNFLDTTTIIERRGAK